MDVDISKNLIALLMAFGFLLGGCVSYSKVTTLKNQSVKDLARNSYDNARAAIMREPALSIDLIWVLKELQKVAKDDTLDAFVDEKADAIQHHHSLLLINPDAPRTLLPQERPTGSALYRTYLRAPFAQPKEEAIEYIREFVTAEKTGYDLTHQFLVLEWAQQTDLGIPEDLLRRQDVLYKKIYCEQQADSSFVDLYAERAALLLRFGKVDFDHASEWIRFLATSQLPDGNWKLDSIIRAHDGEISVLTPPARHTTALALLAFQVYLHQY